MEIKPHKTYEEQVTLIEAKGFLVQDKAACIDFLKQVNYYRLSAYFLPFRKKDKTYLPKVPLQRVRHIYEFDKRLRALLFETIEEIELYLRTQFAYYSGLHHGPLGYLDKQNFSKRHNNEAFLKKIKQCIEENKNTLVVKHHQQNYSGRFPIWVMIEFFSVGMLSYFYSDLKTPDQKALAREMYQTSSQCLCSWLFCLTGLRNRCAHYSRLYFWAFPAMPKIPKGFSYQGDRTLFTQILTLKFLYPNANQWNAHFLSALQALVEKFEPDIDLQHIGFPSNWEALLHK